MLTGCAGWQSPIGSVNTAQQTGNISANLHRGASQIRHGTSGQQLLYAAVFEGYRIYVFLYPYGGFGYAYQLKEPIVGTLCSDTTGHVFVPAGNTILEYGNGSGQIGTLYEKNDYAAYDCSIDPTTGNLAAAGKNLPASRAVIAERSVS